MNNVVTISATLIFLLFGTAFAQSATPEERLKELGISLRTPGPAPANRANAVRTGNLLFVSGHTSQWPTKGKVGKELAVEQGQQVPGKGTGNYKPALHCASDAGKPQQGEAGREGRRHGQCPRGLRGFAPSG